MKDIPIFTTSHGVASLTLKEIPYTGKAYIRIQDSLEPEKLITECIDFCRALGAELVYATGHNYLSKFEKHCRIVKMRCAIDHVQNTNGMLFPVTEKTIDQFRECYNRAMADVPNASYMTIVDSMKLLETGDGYFIHKGEELLGLGVASGDRISAIISLVPGAGGYVLQTLFYALSGTFAEVEVAEENISAARLYEKLGFLPVEEIAVWYKIS